MALYFVSCIFDKNEELGKVELENRRKERAGAVQDDDEYDLQEQILVAVITNYKLLFFASMYIVLMSFGLVYYWYSMLEEQHLISIGDFSSRAEEKAGFSIFSLPSLSSTLSSWSVICSGGA